MGTGMRAALAVVAAGTAAVAAAPAVAERPAATHGTAARAAAVPYVFYGRVAAAPGPNATALQVQVSGGSRPALRLLLGATQPTSFALGPATRFVVWTPGARANVPSVGSSSTLQAGDAVAVTLRGRPHATLAELLARPAARVGDFSAATRPAGRLFLYQGPAVAVDRAARTVTIDVRWGNWPALHAMLGQPVRQTFRYDAGTLFLHWERGVPRFLSPADVRAGDRLTLRLRAPAGTSQAALSSTPLWKVNDREPQALVAADAPTS